MDNEEKANQVIGLNRKSKQDRKIKSALNYKQSDDYEKNKQSISQQNLSKDQQEVRNNFEASYDEDPYNNQQFQQTNKSIQKRNDLEGPFVQDEIYQEDEMMTANSVEEQISQITNFEQKMEKVKQILKDFMRDRGLLPKFGGGVLQSGARISTFEAKKLESVFLNTFDVQLQSSSKAAQTSLFDLITSNSDQIKSNNQVIQILNKIVKNFLLDLSVDQYSILGSVITDKFITDLSSKKQTDFKKQLSLNNLNKAAKNDKQLMQQIADRYNNPVQQTVPRYMSPTLAEQRKNDMKKKGMYDAGDKVDMAKVFRKSPTANTLNQTKMTGDSRPEWRPSKYQINGVINSFDKIVPATKLANLINYNKNESPLRNDPQAQAKFFERLHKEGEERQLKKVEYFQKGIEYDLEKCTFIPNRYKTSNSPYNHDTGMRSSAGGIQIFQTTESQGNINLELGYVNNDYFPDHKTSTDQKKTNSFIQGNSSEKRKPKAEASHHKTMSFQKRNRSVHQNEHKNYKGTIFDDNFNQQIYEPDSPKLIASYRSANYGNQSQTGRSRSKKDLFEYLTREGAKTSRINEFEKIKEEIELENCTFTPQIIKNFKPRIETMPQRDLNLKVEERLMKLGQEKAQLKQAQTEYQLRESMKKECTFHPQINKNKRRSNSASNLMEQLSKENKKVSKHQALYDNHKDLQLKKQLLKQEILEERFKECTYQPRTNKSVLRGKKEKVLKDAFGDRTFEQNVDYNSFTQYQSVENDKQPTNIQVQTPVKSNNRKKRADRQKEKNEFQ